jgi:hypothetical protein
MYRNFKKISKNADYSGGIMETGDHFKNGASPKSQMSRGNFLMSVKGADVKQILI